MMVWDLDRQPPRRGLLLTCLVIASIGCGDDNPGGGADAARGMDAGPPPPDPDAGSGECLPEDPLIAPDLLPTCDLCANARCVPLSFVPEEQRDLLADCGEEGKCVPDLLIETNGNYTLATCRSLNDAEGRCVSTCLPAAAEQADRLPTESHRCVPCFDPTSGDDTGSMPLERRHAHRASCDL